MLNNGPETDTAIYDGTNNGLGLTEHTAQVSMGSGWLACVCAAGAWWPCARAGEGVKHNTHAGTNTACV
jgi:hypothetical protein